MLELFFKRFDTKCLSLNFHAHTHSRYKLHRTVLRLICSLFFKGFVSDIYMLQEQRSHIFVRATEEGTVTRKISLFDSEKLRVVLPHMETRSILFYLGGKKEDRTSVQQVFTFIVGVII